MTAKLWRASGGDGGNAVETLRLGRPPTPPTPLIGREAELEAVTSLVLADGARVVTLVGPGGVGKTRLALDLARGLERAFDHEIRFVDLSPLRDATMVPSTISLALGLRERGDRSALETLTDGLGDRRVLLVLDNLEQVIDCAPALAALVGACPGVVILATSRQPLRIRSEQVFAVPPLAVPEDRAAAGERATPETIGSSPAASLFLTRVRAIDPGFVLTEDEAPVVAAICRRLDGLPLALELGAGWCRVLPPRALLARLDDRLGLLMSGAVDLPERQRTLRDAVGWSYELLAAEEQRLFRRLAVFVGGWTAEAAVAVAGDSGSVWEEQDADPSPALGTAQRLATLVDHSLIRPETAAGQRRFTMLETIGEYGREQLAAAGESDDARGRHAAFYLRLAERAEPSLWGGPEQGAWLDRLVGDIDNLRAALDWSLRGGDADTATRLVAPLGLLLQTRGSLGEARERLEQVLAGCEGCSDATRARVSTVAATVAMSQGHLERAVELGVAALNAGRRGSDEAGIARCLNVLGGCALLQGDLPLAATRLDEALSLRRVLGDEAGVASVLHNLGAVAVLRGSAAAATDFLDEARRIASRLGDKGIEALTLRQLGELAQARGDYPAATELGEAALRLDRELGDTGDAAWSLVRLAGVSLDEGDPSRARTLVEEAVSLARQVGDEPAVGEGLVLLGRASARMGETEGAAEALNDALAIGTSLDDAVIVGAARAALGELARARGDGAEAAKQVGEALSLHRAGDDVPGLLGPLEGAALLLAQAGKAEAAARLFGAVEGLRESVGVAVPAAERAGLRRVDAGLRSRLGTRTMAEAWAGGRSVSAAEVVAEAMAAIMTVSVSIAPSQSWTAQESEVGPLRPGGLSEREAEVLRLVAGGLTNVEIAETLFLSPHTVNAHLRRVYGKLDVTSRSAATRFALEHGLA